MATDLTIGLLQSINEPQCCIQRVLAQIVIDCLFDISLSEFARYDGSGRHRAAPRLGALTFRRSASK